MRHKVEVDVEITPTMLAETFAGMDSTAQAQTLGLIWHEMERRCGGSFKRAMQCSYIREALGREGEEFVDELYEQQRNRRIHPPQQQAEPVLEGMPKAVKRHVEAIEPWSACGPGWASSGVTVIYRTDSGGWETETTYDADLTAEELLAARVARVALAVLRKRFEK